MAGCWENGTAYLLKKMLHTFNIIRIMEFGAK